MSSQTNIALNSRSLNGIITISDGTATIENGELNCNNINSDTANIQSLTVPTIYGDNLNDCTLINCITDADPTIPDGVANKNYVDNSISGGLTNVAYVNASNTFSGTNTFNGATVFNTIPTTAVAPTTSNDLCNKNYVDNSSHSLAGYAKLADANIFTANQIFNNGMTIGSVGGFAQFIDARNGAGNFNLLTNMASIINLGNATNTATLEYNTYLHLYKTKNITGTITLGYPLVETNIIRMTTVDITITLPLVSAVHIGLTIKFFKTSSTSQIVTLTPNASNRILYDGTITEQTSDAISLNGTSTYCSLTVCLLNSGLYGWISANSPIQNKVNIAYLNVNNTFSANNNFTGQSQFTTLIINNDRVRLGQSSVVSADQGIAIGETATVTSISSIAIGAESLASGLTGENVAIGYQAKAQDIECTAIGAQSEANHFLSTAIGYGVVTTADYQTRIGIPGQLGQITDTVIATDTIHNRLNNPIDTFSDCGVWLVNTASGQMGYVYPLFKSVSDLTNFTNQTEVVGSTVPQGEANAIYGPPQGTFYPVTINDVDDYFIVYPKWSLVGYSNAGYGGLIRINYYNNTNDVKTVRAVVSNSLSSVRIFYNHVLL